MSKNKAVKSLRWHATHFVQRDWEWTRLNDIKHIRYEGDYEGYFSWRNRIKRAARDAFGLKRKDIWFSHPDTAATSWQKLQWNFLMRWAMVRVNLRSKDHLPDGVLDGGSIIAHWEETGEYLQMVQPSVGEMLADFLDAEPENPHAKKIIAELERIRARYTERIKAGEVDGKKRD